MGQNNDLKKALHKAILKAFRSGKYFGEKAARTHSVNHIVSDVEDPNMQAQVPSKDLPVSGESVLHKDVTLSEINQQKQANAMAKLGQPMKAPGRIPGASMSAPGKMGSGAVSAPGAAKPSMSMPSGASSKPMKTPSMKPARPLKAFMQKRLEKAKIVAGPGWRTKAMGEVLADLPSYDKEGNVIYQPKMDTQQEIQATGTDNIPPQAPRKKRVVREKSPVRPKNEWENIVFQQGDDANEALDVYFRHGPKAAIKHLMQWHFPGEHEVLDKHPDKKAGTTDSLHHHKVKGINYVLTANPRYNYIGLSAEKKNKPF